jgi:putative photosynthetic complex assembly protein
MAHAPSPELRAARRAADQRAMVPLLRAVAALVLLSLVMVAGARIAGYQPAATPDDTVPVVAERMIRIVGAPDSSAKVMDENGTIFADLGPMEAGFISGVNRALERTRKLNKIEGNPPVRLVRFADGRLALRDPSTGWRAELIGFGDTNRDAFLALLED